MLSNRISYLAPPPRPVPLRVVCAAMLGIVGGMGAIFFLFGMIFVWIFAGDINLLDEWRLARSTSTSQAIVTQVTGTSSSENDETVYRYTFSFETHEEKTVTAHSYSTGGLYSEGTSVNVTYLPDKPGVARLEGTRLSTFSPWVLLFVSIFPLIGLVMLVASTVSGLSQVFLLSYGEIGGAHVLSSKLTGMSMNKQPVIEYRYELRTRDGQCYEGKSRALPSGRVGDEAEEPALYLPSNPKLSVLVDALPLRYPLEVDTSGQWVSHDQPWPVVWFSLAWMGITAAVVYSLLRLLS
jgi:hypothetical protein